MAKDTVTGTLTVAALICIACSILVSGSAVSLKPRQVENAKLDVKKNLLMASGLLENAKASKAEILEKFKVIETKVVDLDTGNYVDVDPESFSMKKAAKDPKQNKVIAAADDTAGIKKRSKLAQVYFVKENGSTSMIVLPVYGKGLWSTMYGFLALSPDTKTVKGLGFYAHGETPGLGGEIDNPSWKALWKGKVALDDNYVPVLKVIKGTVDAASSSAKHEVDGLSGATITSNGVTTMVHYWLGNDGYGKFLSLFRGGQ